MPNFGHSISNKMYVEFRTDDSTNKKGFFAEASALTGGNYIISTTLKRII